MLIRETSKIIVRMIVRRNSRRSLGLAVAPDSGDVVGVPIAMVALAAVERVTSQWRLLEDGRDATDVVEVVVADDDKIEVGDAELVEVGDGIGAVVNVEILVPSKRTVCPAGEIRSVPSPWRTSMKCSCNFPFPCPKTAMLRITPTGCRTVIDRHPGLSVGMVSPWI